MHAYSMYERPVLRHHRSACFFLFLSFEHISFYMIDMFTYGEIGGQKDYAVFGHCVIQKMYGHIQKTVEKNRIID